MHYIVHLFRVFQLTEQLAEPPFTRKQLEVIERGQIPAGGL